MPLVGSDISEDLKSFPKPLQPRNHGNDVPPISEVKKLLTTEFIKTEELNEPQVSTSYQENSENNLITEKMKSEEKFLLQEAIKEERRLKKEAKARLQEEEREAQENRVKMLRHLLNKSKFYSDYINTKVEEFKKEEKMKHDAVATGKKAAKGSKKKKQMNQMMKDKELLDNENAMDTPSSENGQEIRKEIVQPRLFEGGVMRDYQLEGFDWLANLYMVGVNGILADEMGLGKTIQSIALICHIIEKKFAGPFLIIGPLSTLSNWITEFQRFAPQVPVVLYHGSMDERKALWPKLKERKHFEFGSSLGTLPVVITSYEVAMKDKLPLQYIKWGLMIIDEGHRIKNFQCKLVTELRQFNCYNRMLLTGTPLQNNLQELWSLLNFLLPEIFSDLNVFESWFEATDFSTVEGDFEATKNRLLQFEEKDNMLSTLHKILHPFMLRRVKADVELSLPPKKELLVFTPLSPLQDKLYRAILNNTIHQVLRPEEEPIEVEEMTENGPVQKRKRRSCAETTKFYNFDRMSSRDFENLYSASIFSDVSATQEVRKGLRTLSKEQGFLTSLNGCSPMTDMRKLVNHPYLLRFPIIPGTNMLKIDEELVTSSGKMLVLDAMLGKLKQQGHKVLIFSQFVMMLDMLEEYLLMRRYHYCRLDGSRSVMDRKENIDLFNNDPEILVFLVSTRAGGLGINLTSADTVIIYDSDWNPQCDLQAQDRCHRIGQTRPVVVYRLTTDGTIDRRMVERATGKRRLEKLVIKKGRFHGNKNKSSPTDNDGLSAQELLELLNSKDYVKTIQSNGYIYTDEELEILLDRSDLLGKKVVATTTSKSCDLFEIVEQVPATK